MTTAFNELKRLFGPENVHEEYRVPPTYIPSPITWCYVVTLSADSPLWPKPPESPMELGVYVMRAESVFDYNNDLDVSWHFSGEVGTQIDKKYVGKIPSSKAIPPRHFVFIRDELEEPQNVAVLQGITCERLRHAVASLDNDDIHAKHQSILRHAAYGVQWEFVSDASGDYYRSTRQFDHPESVQMAILSALGTGMDRTHWREPQEGRACIPMDALLQGNLQNLMESIFERRPTFTLVPTNRSSSRRMP